MKKVTIILTALIALTMGTNAQIPNAGFENWTHGSPDGWSCSNIEGIYAPITQTSQAHSGNFALQGETFILIGQIISDASLIVGTTDSPGFPFDQRPVSFTGYYKFSPATSSGDRLFVNIFFTDGGLMGTVIGNAVVTFSQAADDYTQFSLPLFYVSSDVPKTCLIQFAILGPSVESPQPTIGSYYILDDLAFEGITDVEVNQTDCPNEFEISQNYPNPFNPSTTIKYELPKNSFVKISVYDLLGREIQTIVNEEKLSGTYEATFDGSNLSNGVYFYKIIVSSYSSVRKMLLLK